MFPRTVRDQSLFILMGNERVEFFSRGSHHFQGERLGIIRRQHSIKGVTIQKLTATRRGWRGEVVIRIVQSPPTQPQTLNNERSLNSTRYQSEKDILYSYTQLKLVSLSNNFKLKRWSVISWDSNNVLLSLHSALLEYCVWRGSHYSLWNDRKIEKGKERKREKNSLFWVKG